MSKLARLKGAQVSDFALRFSLNVNSYNKIESYTLCPVCLLIKYVFIYDFCPNGKKNYHGSLG